MVKVGRDARSVSIVGVGCTPFCDFEQHPETQGIGEGEAFGYAALEAIADRAIERKIGARGLRSIMEGIMTEIMYTAPSDTGILKVIITEDCVRGNSQPTILRTRDLAG